MKFQEITDWVDEHTKMLDKVEQMTKRLLKMSENEDSTDSIASEIENRERLLFVLENIQNNVESLLEKFLSLKLPLSNDQIKYLKDWKFAHQQKTESIQKMDERLVLNLSKVKDETTQEIARVFQAGQNLRGYNLKDVKR